MSLIFFCMRSYDKFITACSGNPVRSSFKLVVPTYEDLDLLAAIVRITDHWSYIQSYYPYFHVCFSREPMSSPNLSPTTLRFVTESLASKILKTQVLLGELGALELTIWKLILNVLPPLSPPTFSQISSEGIQPSCQ